MLLRARKLLEVLDTNVLVRANAKALGPAGHRNESRPRQPASPVTLDRIDRHVPPVLGNSYWIHRDRTMPSADYPTKSWGLCAP